MGDPEDSGQAGDPMEQGQARQPAAVEEVCDRCGIVDRCGPEACRPCAYSPQEVLGVIAFAAACLLGILVFAGVLSVWGMDLVLPRAPPPPHHPLNPFSSHEAKKCIALLSRTAIPNSDGQKYFDPSTDQLTAFYEQDPPKAAVLAWNPGALPPRLFYFSLVKRGAVWAGLVNASAVVSWRRIDTVNKGQPGLSDAECALAASLPLQDSAFQAGLAARHTAAKDVRCLCHPWGALWNRTDAALEQQGHRLVHVSCLVAGTTTNPWFRPLPGLFAVVDLTTGTVARVIDDRSDGVEVPPGDDFDDVSLHARFPHMETSPFVVSQPQGPGYELVGNLVTWEGWRFHLKPHPRAGLVISQAQFLDPSTGSYRSVLYQLHASEVYIPHQSESWDFGTRVTEAIGTLGFGRARIAVPAIDCPPYATVLPSRMVTGDGKVVEQPKAYCLFERPAQFPSWRHAGDTGSRPNGRGQTELVARLWVSAVSFDYLIDYIFTPRGSINVQTTITGVLQVQPTLLASVDPLRRFDQFNGVYISPNLVAPLRSHFISFRIDIDIDQPSPNRFVREAIIKKRLPDPSPSGRKSIWGVTELPAASERDAMALPSLQTPGVWNFRHSSKTTQLGNPVGYKVCS